MLEHIKAEHLLFDALYNAKTPNIAQKRIYFLVDSAMRVFAPVAFANAKQYKKASILRAHPAITDRASVRAAMDVVKPWCDATLPKQSARASALCASNVYQALRFAAEESPDGRRLALRYIADCVHWAKCHKEVESIVLKVKEIL